MHNDEKILTSGEKKDKADKFVICLHGRGAPASDVLNLVDKMKTNSVCFLAPQADNLTWYPYSFLEKQETNQPYLDSALALLDKMIFDLIDSGVAKEKIFLLGFSQGACLALEYLAARGGPLGGIISFSGGLIGSDEEVKAKKNDLKQTPVFIGCGDRDPHIPVHRVQDSFKTLEDSGALVEVRIYPQMGHLVNQDEIDAAEEFLNS